jgi:hypothetical protein
MNNDIQSYISQWFEVSYTPSVKYIFPIRHDTGDLLFNVIGGDTSSLEWTFTDGSTLSGVSSINKVGLPAGISYVEMTDFTNTDISSLTTGGIYEGLTTDIPQNISNLELQSTSISGDIYELSDINESIIITNTPFIYGDVGTLDNVSDTLNLSGCVNVDGNIGELLNVDIVNLDGTDITGTISSSATAVYWSLNDTGLTKAQVQNSLINVAEWAVNETIIGGHFECYDNMPTIDSPEACIAMGALLDRSWTIVTHHLCAGY